MPTPEHTAKADQFHTMCQQIFEHYVSAIEHDMNVYVEEHGTSMDMTFAHNDLTRILLRHIQPANLAGVVAHAVLKEIERKGRGGRA
jgi:hypothetical protein